MKNTFKYAASHKGCKDFKVYENCKNRLKKLDLKPSTYDKIIAKIIKILCL